MKRSETLLSTLDQISLLLATTLNHNTKKSQPKLSMIWVKKFDGERDRLMARWVTQD